MSSRHHNTAGCGSSLFHFYPPVLKPGIDLICDPDYLNQKLLSWLEYREMLYLESKRTYSYAATYEDFMKMIDQCHDIEHLKQMRYTTISYKAPSYLLKVNVLLSNDVFDMCMEGYGHLEQRGLVSHAYPIVKCIPPPKLPGIM